MSDYKIHNLVYLHGFASSPNSNKANHITKFFKNKGINIHIPDLNCGNFTDTTISKMLDRISSDIEEINESFIIVGSSMGGYLAALFAERHKRSPMRLILLAPGFDLCRLFTKWLGEYGIDKWKRDGYFDFLHYSYNSEIPLSYEFYRDLCRHSPYPDIKGIAAHIIHGSRDDVVPVEVSKIFQSKNPQTTIEITNDTHELSSSIDLITNRIDAILKDF